MSVHRGKDGWYFWDAWQSDLFGPYPTQEVANEARLSYVKWIDGGGHLPQFPLSTAAERREFIEAHARLS
jgi:hypothetical protein